MNKFSTIRFNRYGKGQIMRQHHDHIHSLFDGNEKGIPVLSFILNLNDNYRGADLYFWEDHAVHLGKGDIIMFPSLFLFPHGVTEAREGVRYSAVSWDLVTNQDLHDHLMQPAPYRDVDSKSPKSIAFPVVII